LIVFEELLMKHADVFHNARTAHSLFLHWQHMKHYCLLDEHTTSLCPLAPYDSNDFAEIESSLQVEPDPVVEPIFVAEMLLAERHMGAEIRLLENELPKWNALTKSITGLIFPSDFDAETLAYLRGRVVRYRIRSQTVTLGRANRRTHVDVDLSLEGPAFKLCRRQACITLSPQTGEFSIANEGRVTMYIDGQPLLAQSIMRLDNNAVVEVGHVRLVFVVNPDVQAKMRADAVNMSNSQSSIVSMTTD